MGIILIQAAIFKFNVGHSIPLIGKGNFTERNYEVLQICWLNNKPHCEGSLCTHTYRTVYLVPKLTVPLTREEATDFYQSMAEVYSVLPNRVFPLFRVGTQNQSLLFRSLAFGGHEDWSLTPILRVLR